MIRWFAEHPTAANLMMIAIILLGIKSLPSLQRESFPQVKNDKVGIVVAYPGAVAEDIEDAVCRRLEDALEGIAGIDEMICEASENKASATAIMIEGGNMARFLDDVKSSVDAINNFPDLAEEPVIEELGRTDGVVSIAITGPTDASVLKAYAEDVKLRLLVDARISNVNIKGFSDHQIRVEINAAKLRQFSLSLSDIATAMQNQSVNLPSGRLESNAGDILIRFDDQRKTIEQVGDIVIISASSGAFIHLRDIASITNRFEQAENKIYFNGQRAAILDVSKTKSQDILHAFADVKDFVILENAQLPNGIKLTLTQDKASNVKDRLNMIYGNAMQGLVMVFLVLWLFFSFKYSFWVTMGLPVSFLGALFLLPFFGMTINMISLVGLLIGVGLLMDDAIVISENIASKLEQGENALDAAVNGTKQVLPGVLSSFATTLMIFGSLAFISGSIGQVLKVMPIVLIIVISVSLVEAFFILPNHLAHSLKDREKTPSKFRTWFENKFDNLRENIFGPMIDLAVNYRYATVGLAIMFLLVALSFPMGGKLKFVGFPATDGDIVEARLLLPQGTPLALTEERVNEIYNAALAVSKKLSSQQPDGQNLVVNTTIIYAENPDAYETGPHVARIIVDLLSSEVRNTTIDEFRTAWRETIGEQADVIALTFGQPTVGHGGRAIEIRLKGQEMDNLKQASYELQTWLKQYHGVIDVADDTRPGKKEVRLHLKESAGVLGVNASLVANQVRAAFQGITIDEFPVGVETYEVDLRLAKKDSQTLESLQKFTIISPSGHQIPLPNIVSFEEVRGWARINRVDRKRTVTIVGDVLSDQANAQEILGLAAKDIFLTIENKYPNISIEVKGASNNSAETGKSIVTNILTGLVGLYLLLAMQFKSYKEPITVMALIPAAFIGVVFGHVALGLNLTMPSIIGMASLFGVVVNDSILLVVFMREKVKAGVDVVSAAQQAGRARFRPILLTSITTVAGLTPLLLETSIQAQILIPMATSLAFGLTFATIIALFLVPALFCILNADKAR